MNVAFWLMFGGVAGHLVARMYIHRQKRKAVMAVSQTVSADTHRR